MGSNVLEYKGNKRLAWLFFIFLNSTHLGLWSSFYLGGMALYIYKINFIWLLNFLNSFLCFTLSKFICSEFGDSVIIRNREIELHKWYGRKTIHQINDNFELNTEFKYHIYSFFKVNMDTNNSGLLQLKQESGEPIYIPIGGKNIEGEIQWIKDILNR